MLADQVSLFRCPGCGSGLTFEGNEESGMLRCAVGHQHPVVRGIPRFVEADNYAASFGWQWNHWSGVQLDSRNGTTISTDRFKAVTGWNEADLRGQRVLDVGCGAGRFAEVAHKFGADLVGADLSNAVEACRENLGAGNGTVVQASAFDLPFAPGSFDKVYCIGVIQHTPDPERALRSLARMVRPGGQVAVWIYELSWKSFVGTSAFRYAFRPITSRMSQDAQRKLAQVLTAIFFPIVRVCMGIGQLGRFILRMLPVPAVQLFGLKLPPDQLRIWLLLDTFDSYAPAHDHPMTMNRVLEILAEEGFTDVARQNQPAIALHATRSTRPAVTSAGTRD